MHFMNLHSTGEMISNKPKFNKTKYIEWYIYKFIEIVFSDSETCLPNIQGFILIKKEVSCGFLSVNFNSNTIKLEWIRILAWLNVNPYVS